MKDILNPLPGPSAYLRFDPIYDQIREARRFEYEHFSQGIWKKEVKKADFERVEFLCTNVLTKRSKDLQVLGWLLEAWVARYGLEGCSNGLYVLSQFIERYWDLIVPTESSYRLSILEWMEGVLCDRLMLVPLTGEPLYALSDFVDSWGNERHLALFQKALEKTNPTFIESIQENVTRSLSLLDTLERQFYHMHMDVSWSYFRKCLTDITQALNTPITETIEPVAHPEPIAHDNSVVVSGRDQAYEALAEIGMFLKKIDPHSPAHHFISLVVEWKGKDLLHILSEIKTREEPVYQLLRMIGKN